MIKVSVLTPWVSRMGGGLQYSVKDLLGRLADDGRLRYKVLSYLDAFSNEDAQLWDRRIELSLFPFRGPDNFRFSLPYLRAVVNEPCDVMQLHGIWMFHAAAAAFIHRRRRVPLIVSPHGMLDPWIVRRNRPKKLIAELLFENSLRENANIYRALNRKEADAIRKVAPKAKIIVLPNGVELPEELALSAKGAVDKAQREILFLGRLHEKKGVLELIQAIEMVWKTTQHRPHLTIAGWGDDAYVQQVNRSISEAPAGSCAYVGPLHGAAKANAFRDSDAFILPSHSEGLPMAVLEACSYGVPALISDGCNLENLVEAEAAIRVCVEPTQLSRELTAFCERSSVELREMGLQARRIVEESYTWPSIAGRLTEVTVSLANGDPVDQTFLY